MFTIMNSLDNLVLFSGVAVAATLTISLVATGSSLWIGLAAIALIALCFQLYRLSSSHQALARHVASLSRATGDLESQIGRNEEATKRNEAVASRLEKLAARLEPFVALLERLFGSESPPPTASQSGLFSWFFRV